MRSLPVRVYIVHREREVHRSSRVPNGVRRYTSRYVLVALSLVTLWLVPTEGVAQTGISVVRASYGANAGAPSGNVTGALAAACNGRTTCDYRVDHTAIGDPSPGKAKDYVAVWRCGGGAEQSATLSAEASGKTIQLACASAPPPLQQTGSGIGVVSASYGSNVGVPLGNVTSALAAACNGRTTCDYGVDHNVLGDPSPGKAKDYVAVWRCGGGAEQRATLAAEASGKTIRLTCASAPDLSLLADALDGKKFMLISKGDRRAIFSNCDGRWGATSRVEAYYDQWWTLGVVGTRDIFQLISVGSGRALFNNTNPAPNNFGMYPSHPESGSQSWRFVQVGPATYHLVNVQTGNALYSKNGNEFGVYPANASWSDQWWTLEPIAGTHPEPPRCTPQSYAARDVVSQIAPVNRFAGVEPVDGPKFVGNQKFYGNAGYDASGHIQGVTWLPADRYLVTVSFSQGNGTESALAVWSTSARAVSARRFAHRTGYVGGATSAGDLVAVGISSGQVKFFHTRGMSVDDASRLDLSCAGGTEFPALAYHPKQHRYYLVACGAVYASPRDVNLLETSCGQPGSELCWTKLGALRITANNDAVHDINPTGGASLIYDSAADKLYHFAFGVGKDGERVWASEIAVDGGNGASLLRGWEFDLVERSGELWVPSFRWAGSAYAGKDGKLVFVASERDLRKVAPVWAPSEDTSWYPMTWRNP